MGGCVKKRIHNPPSLKVSHREKAWREGARGKRRGGDCRGKGKKGTLE